MTTIGPLSSATRTNRPGSGWGVGVSTACLVGTVLVSWLVPLSAAPRTFADADDDRPAVQSTFPEDEPWIDDEDSDSVVQESSPSSLPTAPTPAPRREVKPRALSPETAPPATPSGPSIESPSVPNEAQSSPAQALSPAMKSLIRTPEQAEAWRRIHERDRQEARARAARLQAKKRAPVATPTRRLYHPAPPPGFQQLPAPWIYPISPLNPYWTPYYGSSRQLGN